MAGVYTSASGMGLSRKLGLSGFWDDVYNIGGKVAEVAKTAQQAAIAGREVQAGNAQVTVVPTKQGLVNYTGQAASNNMVQLGLVVGGLGLATYLLTRNQSRPRRRSYRR